MSRTPRSSRRAFLKHSLLAAGATFTISGTKSSGRVLGANDRVRVAVAGLHGRGKSHMDGFAGRKDAEVTIVVDPDMSQFGPAQDRVQEKGGSRPKAVQDIRRVLDDPNIDAVSIATPNHWHSLMTIWSCQAGKDVYVEKPCSHNVHEGRIAVEAARKYGRIVQHGTQSRSSASWAGVVDFIRSGQAGKLLVSRALCYKPRKSIGFKSNEAAPSDLDFNLWLGPAPEQPFHRNLVHYNWHWFWDTGNGDIGNQGVHQMDIARWGIPDATLPTKVISLGGRFGYEDQGQTPNTQIAVMDYGATQLIFEVRGLPTDGLMDQKIGNIFYLEGGTIAGSNFYPKGSSKPERVPDGQRGPGDGPFGNFVAAVKSRKKEDLNAEILEGHYSSAMCHLANVSYQLGQPATYDPVAKSLGDNREAVETLERMAEHLKSNELKPADLKYTLGRSLTFDPQAERFVGDEDANALLSRPAREPFAVPEKLA